MDHLLSVDRDHRPAIRQPYSRGFEFILGDQKAEVIERILVLRLFVGERNLAVTRLHRDLMGGVLCDRKAQNFAVELTLLFQLTSKQPELGDTVLDCLLRFRCERRTKKPAPGRFKKPAPEVVRVC